VPWPVRENVPAGAKYSAPTAGAGTDYRGG
jgi:hypothetical protein